MTGPLWEAGHGVHWISRTSPAFTGASAPAGVAPKWQTISGLAYALGLTNVFLTAGSVLSTVERNSYDLLEIIWSRPPYYGRRWSGPLIARVISRIAGSYQQLQYTLTLVGLHLQCACGEGDNRCCDAVRVGFESQEEDTEESSRQH